MSGSARQLRLATRESPLALWQAHHVADLITQATGTPVELVPLTTLGDRDRVERLSSFGNVGVFTKEIQRAVLEDQADLAVHSLKDLPTEPTEGLVLAGVPCRASRFDALILPIGRTGTWESLPPQARIGTGSPRRRSQLLRLRPDFQLFDIRGNVETRLAKLDRGEFDAVILAEAGLERLQLQDRISQRLQPPEFFPAVSQAALGVECRTEDQEARAILQQITDSESLAEVLAERACLRTLRAGCHAPVGVLSSVQGEKLQLEAVVMSQDGADRFHAQATGTRHQPEQLGEQVAQQLIASGATKVLHSDPT